MASSPHASAMEELARAAGKHVRDSYKGQMQAIAQILQSQRSAYEQETKRLEAGLVDLRREEDAANTKVDQLRASISNNRSEMEKLGEIIKEQEKNMPIVLKEREACRTATETQEAQVGQRWKELDNMKQQHDTFLRREFPVTVESAVFRDATPAVATVHRNSPSLAQQDVFSQTCRQQPMPIPSSTVEPALPGRGQAPAARYPPEPAQVSGPPQEAQNSQISRKRQRVQQEEEQDSRRKSQKTVSLPTEARVSSDLSIPYDQVYAGGTPSNKIVEWPEQSNDWYILRCLDHPDTTLDSFRGAQGHLSHADHADCKGRTWKNIIRWFGLRVEDCTRDLAGRNNSAFDAQANEFGVFQDGDDGSEDDDYRATPPPALPSSRSRSRPRRNTGTTTSSHTEGAVSSAECLDTADNTTPRSTIEPGQVYEVLYDTSRIPWLVVVLPLGDLAQIAMTGSLTDDRLLRFPGDKERQRVWPECYEVLEDPRTQEKRVALKPGYRSGEPLAHKVRYPVMYFDDPEGACFRRPGAREPMNVSTNPVDEFRPPPWSEPNFEYGFFRAHKLLPIDLFVARTRDVKGWQAAIPYVERLLRHRALLRERSQDEDDHVDMLPDPFTMESRLEPLPSRADRFDQQLDTLVRPGTEHRGRSKRQPLQQPASGSRYQARFLPRSPTRVSSVTMGRSSSPVRLFGSAVKHRMNDDNSIQVVTLSTPTQAKPI
ncbi:hypothetical protein V8F20_012149 [Naviculisporaceae sp. PSN 640]